MMKKTRNIIAVAAVVAIVIFSAIAISMLYKPAQKNTLKFGYVLWDGEIAATNVMTLVLQEAGFDVEMINVDAGVMFQSLASGDLDFSVSVWLPVTQKNYWEQYGSQLDSIGINLEGCLVGLAVPTYMTELNSMEDLANYSAELDGKIVGIDPGAGMMTLAQNAIDEYGMNVDLQSSSGAAMMAALSDAYPQETPIVVTLWSPHWAFSTYDLKYLDDPKGVFGGAEHVETVARIGFAEAEPVAYGILEKFKWTQSDIQSVMKDISDGMDEKVAAQKWIDANRATVDQWLGL